MLSATVALALVGAVLPVHLAPDSSCRITDKRLNELSGLVTDGSGYVVVNDGADDPAGRKIFFLNKSCKVTRTVSYPSRPRDTEDLGRGADGTLWVGDIGDNGQSRDSIGVWRLPPGAKKPVLMRMSYPDGGHDAEALLVSADGTPIVITKDPLAAGVYVPEGRLDPDETTPLRRAGEFRIPITTTSNPYSFKGRLVITGAGMSADGRRVVLRSYADAFEIDVASADTEDLVTAISGGSSRTIALPDEPQGESITYAADGSALLTVSEKAEDDTTVEILRYPLESPAEPAPTTASAETKPAETTGREPVAAADESGLPTGAIVAGLALALAAVGIGLVSARRRR